MQDVWLAIIAGIVGIASPMLLAWLTNRNRRLEKEQDWARQDEVARKAAEAARLLLESNSKVNGKLGAIHVLVNSNLTAALQAELDATTRELVLAEELIALKRVAGHEPSIETLAMIEATRSKIGELQAALADRRVRQADNKAPG